MILSVGARTDVVTYYSEWLKRRFDEGFVYTRNPLFPNKVTRYDLDPQFVDCILFLSKNYEPILPQIGDYCSRFRTYFYYGISPYDKDIEPHTYNKEDNIKTLIALSKIVGRERVTWRYEPVFLDSTYTKQIHYDRFEFLASRLAGHIGRCVFSFIDTFHTHRNLPHVKAVDVASKRELAQKFGEIAAKYGIPIQTCCESGDYSEYGISNSACTTLDMLGRVNKCSFGSWKHEGTKRGCRCIVSRDVGWYGTCPNLCRYCHSNESYEEVTAAFKQHDPASPILIGALKDTDTIQKGSHTSFLKNDGRQLSLFD